MLEMMNIGTVSQAVQDRTVLRPFQLRGVYCPSVPDEGAGRTEKSLTAGSFTAGKNAGAFFTAGGSFTGPAEPSLNMHLTQALNLTAAAGGSCLQMQLSFLMPPSCGEAQLKEWTQTAAAFAAAQELKVTDVQAAVSSALVRPVVHVSVLAADGYTDETAGKSPEEPAGRKEGLQPCHLLMAGYTGYAGTAILADYFREELTRRFPSFILKSGLSFAEDILITKQAALLHQHAGKLELGRCICVGEGGVFAALWQLAQLEKSGFDIDLKKIPIRQETVEICEMADVNPYQLFGQGAMLFTAGNAEEAAGLLAQAHLPAAVLGSMTQNKAKIIRNGEETRYLEKPQQDMLWRIQ